MENSPIDLSQFKEVPPLVREGWVSGCFIKSLILSAIVGIVVVLLLPTVRISPGTARRAQCANHFKQIAIALYNYHDRYKSYPPAYTVDDKGRKLHSWRTLILPFLEQQPLYDSIDLTKPWYDPVNEAAFKTEISVFNCPSTGKATIKTTYMAILAPNSCFQREKSCTMNEITDGLSNTMMIVEVDAEHAVPWMEPNDIEADFLYSLNSKSRTSHPGGYQTALVDGSTRFIPLNIKPDILQALISINGGEMIPQDY